MAEEPETLEQTQARLARVSNSPYGPVLNAPVPLPDDGTRPDPYATPVSNVPPVQATANTRRGLTIVGAVIAIGSFLVIGAVVAFMIFAGEPAIDDSSGEPVYSQQWQDFPGVSYLDPQATLDKPSYEQVVAGTEELMSEYRGELTAALGLEWTQLYESYSGVEANGYGGDSMLFYYDPGAWQGSVTLDDPGARQVVLDIFTALSEQRDGDGVLLRNEIYEDDEVSLLDQFGAVELEDQPLWSFFDSYQALGGLYLSTDVLDRNLPADPSFTGDLSFQLDESTNTFYVSVTGYVGTLLKESDRAAFEQALEPYGGDYTP